MVDLAVRWNAHDLFDLIIAPAGPHVSTHWRTRLQQLNSDSIATAFADYTRGHEIPTTVRTDDAPYYQNPFGAVLEAFGIHHVLRPASENRDLTTKFAFLPDRAVSPPHINVYGCHGSFANRKIGADARAARTTAAARKVGVDARPPPILKVGADFSGLTSFAKPEPLAMDKWPALVGEAMQLATSRRTPHMIQFPPHAAAGTSDSPIILDSPSSSE